MSLANFSALGSGGGKNGLLAWSFSLPLTAQTIRPATDLASSFGTRSNVAGDLHAYLVAARLDWNILLALTTVSIAASSSRS